MLAVFTVNGKVLNSEVPGQFYTRYRDTPLQQYAAPKWQHWKQFNEINK